MYKLFHERARIVEAFFCDSCNELTTGLAINIQKLLSGRVGEKVLLVLWGKEGGVMVIEPPGQPFIWTVFEVNNCVFVAVELIAVKSIACPVHRWGERHIGLRVYLFEIELREEGGGRDTVKTISVIKDP